MAQVSHASTRLSLRSIPLALDDSVADRVPIQFDARAFVYPDKALHIAEGTEVHARIGFAVDNDDQLALALQQLIKAEIIEMPAIRDVDARAVRPQYPERLMEQIEAHILFPLALFRLLGGGLLSGLRTAAPIGIEVAPVLLP